MLELIRKGHKAGLLLLVAVMIFTLGACGNKNAEGDQGKAGENKKFTKFEAVDMEGNKVTEAIFANSDITVLNIWGTFCGPCVDEMPALAKLAKDYEADKVQVIGIPTDAVEKSKIEAAKKLVKKTGADFTHILPSDSLMKGYLEDVIAVPETLIINKKGEVLATYQGARPHGDWKKIVDEALAK